MKLIVLVHTSTRSRRDAAPRSVRPKAGGPKLPSDRKAAESVARQWERDAADPESATLNAAALSDALTLLLKTRAEEGQAGPPEQRHLGVLQDKMQPSDSCLRARR
jgi:hypothetical protein